MSAFKNDLRVRILAPKDLGESNRQLYELTDELHYQSDILGLILVPAGLLTDFASIPRFAWRYIDPEDPAILYPATVHDYLYNQNGLLPTGQEYTRERADQVLREAMEVCRARADQRAVVYRMVRWFGGAHWKG